MLMRFGKPIRDVIFAADDRPSLGLALFVVAIIVCCGMSAAQSVGGIPLSPTQRTRIDGAKFMDRLGLSVAGAGDVNGDGYDDAILGGLEQRIDGAYENAFTVVFGRQSGWQDSNLANFETSDLTGFRIVMRYPYSGVDRVASAGDFDGDGYGDVVVSNSMGFNGGPYSGVAYLVFGKPSGFQDVRLDSEPEGRFVEIVGHEYEESFAPTSRGDFNGDGLDDLVVSGPGRTFNGLRSGAVYLLYGRQTRPARIDLGAFSGGSDTEGFRIDGPSQQYHLGNDVSLTGDLNGDSLDDLLIGARGAGHNGIASGSCYVIFGRTSGSHNINLGASPLAASEGFRVDGEQGDGVGASVACGGDLNGDGIDDAILMAPYRARCYVLFGKSSGFAGISLASLSSSEGFRVTRLYDLSESVTSFLPITSAGDLDRDGYDDLVIGIPAPARSLQPPGASCYVILGKSSGFADIEAPDLNTPSDDGVRIASSEHPYNDFGCAVAYAGDMNGDGFSDFIAGANESDVAAVNAGSAYFLWGGDFWGELSGSADLSVTNTQITPVAQWGQLVEYAISLSNLGPLPVANAAIRERFPELLRLVSASASVGSVSANGNQLTVQFGRLPAGATETVNVITAVKAWDGPETSYGAETAYAVCTTYAVGSFNDPDPSNNESSVTTVIYSEGAGVRADILGDCKRTRTRGKNRKSVISTVRVRVKVSNSNAATAASTVARLWLSDDSAVDPSDYPLANVPVPELAPGKRFPIRMNLSVPLRAKGKHVIAVLDAERQVSESDESNNYVVSSPLE